jgi:NADH dehydrogenase
MRVQNVCLLGGTGFVGRALAEALVDRDVRVRVITRRETKSRPLWVLPTLETVVADPQDEVALAAQFEGMDAVVNLCGILHGTGAQTFEHVHVDLPRKVVGACRAAGVRHLAHMSALGALESGPSDYQRSKARGEIVVREAATHLAFTIFRPSVIFGAEDQFLNKFAQLAGLLPLVPLAAASARIQPVWVEDVARVIVSSLGDTRTFNGIYELCGPRVYTLRALVEMAAHLAGHRPLVIGLPSWAGEAQAFVLEHLPGRMLTRDNLKSLSVDNVCAGPFPAVFGFSPTPLEAIAPTYLAGRTLRSRYNLFRQSAGR